MGRNDLLEIEVRRSYEECQSVCKERECVKAEWEIDEVLVEDYEMFLIVFLKQRAPVNGGKRKCLLHA